MRLRIRALAALSVLLSATTLLPLLRDASWLAPVVLAVLCIAATGEGLSRLLVSGWTTIVAQLLVLVVLLTLMFVRDQAIAQILPGPDAIRALVDLSSTGFEDIRRFAIPADVTPGISMLLVGGIGFVAVWVDAAACQLRNPAPAAAGFGLLAIYAVPVAIARDGVPWPLFAAAAASWLALLATDNRSKVGRWGKVLGQTGTSTRPSAGTQLGSSASRPSSRPGDVRLSPGTVGLRVGLVAVAAAVALPTILPAFDTALLTAGAGPGRGGGDSTVTTINPIADLRRNLVLSDPRTVLTYNTTAAQPDYLRMVTLDTFDGTSWLPAKLHATLNQRVADSVLPLPPGLGSNVPTVSAEYTVQADAAFSDPRLPLPYSARRITADGDWRYDESTRNVFATDRDTRGLTYKVESITPEPVAS